MDMPEHVARDIGERQRPRVDLEAQLTTLIREVAGCRALAEVLREADKPAQTYNDGSEWRAKVIRATERLQAAIKATNAQPDLQARVAREMESK